MTIDKPDHCPHCDAVDAGSHTLYHLSNYDIIMSAKVDKCPVKKALLQVGKELQKEKHSLDWLTPEEISRVEFLNSPLLLELNYKEVELCNSCCNELD